MMLKIMRYSYSIMIKYTQKYEKILTLFSLKDLHLQQKATYLLLSFVWYYETIHCKSCWMHMMIEAWMMKTMNIILVATDDYRHALKNHVWRWQRLVARKIYNKGYILEAWHKWHGLKGIKIYETWVHFQIQVWVRVRVRVQELVIFGKVGCGCGD